MSSKLRGYLCALSLTFVLVGCSSLSLSKKQPLSPQDTIIVENDRSDEYFIDGNNINFVAHGFDIQRTEYNYTAADVFESIYFNFDSAIVSERERSKVVDMAKVFTKNASIKILVVGHCDKFGGEQYNLSLGKHRAEAVRDILVSLGIDKKRIVTASLGSSKANKNVSNKEAGISDRRSDIVIHQF
jgi:outer membrane protein OmpA-like peptidoglycan-associated protein